MHELVILRTSHSSIPWIPLFNHHRLSSLALYHHLPLCLSEFNLCLPTHISLSPGISLSPSVSLYLSFPISMCNMLCILSLSERYTSLTLLYLSSMSLSLPLQNLNKKVRISFRAKDLAIMALCEFLHVFIIERILQRELL